MLEQLSDMPETQPINAEIDSKPGSAGAALKGRFAVQAGLLLLIVLATLLAYSPVFFNFFNGDDFVHLTWLSKAIHQPELVWRNFHTSWLDGTTTKFYRPLISVFMVSDYALYGLNGLGFRITNLIFHLSSTVFIYFICKNLQEKVSPGQRRLDWPLFSAGLFALYPLHPEAVSWITGRVDSVVTAFCMGAVYFYMRFSQSKRLLFLTLSLVSAILGLLSKEMAITLPAVFFLYELVYNVFGPKEPSGTVSLKERIVPLFRTVPFFILLAVYFVVRLLALGTFVGGYDNNLTFISNPKAFIHGWLHGLLMFILPLNKGLISSHNFMSKLYPAVVGFSAAAALVTAIYDTKLLRHLVFLLGWLVLCLIPVYKLFNIPDDLQGSRLAYLATVPLCLILSSAVLSSAVVDLRRNWIRACRALLLVYLAIATFVLWTNNQPWKKAGEENNAIRAALQVLYDKIPGDPEILFMGLPDHIDGAYTCRNSLDGMTKSPQLSRDVTKCLMVNAFDPIFPFGYLKDSIAESRDRLYVFRWDSAAKDFKKVELTVPAQDAQALSWTGEALKSCASIPEQKWKPEILPTPDGSLVFKTSKPLQFLQLNLGSHNCFNCDFVEVNLELSEPALAESGCDLLYSNDMYPEFELRRRAHAHFEAGQKKQRVIFAMRGLPEWSFGGNTRAFELLLPPNLQAKIESVSIVPAPLVMPSISFPDSGYFGSKGYIHLTRKDSAAVINADVSRVRDAKKFAVEITRNNLLFEEQNPQVKSRVADSWRVSDTSSGPINLDLKDFKQAGLYEIRVFPLSEDGTVCGAASDHIAISVD